MKALLLIWVLIFNSGCEAAMALSAALSLMHEIKQNQEIEELQKEKNEGSLEGQAHEEKK